MGPRQELQLWQDEDDIGLFDDDQADEDDIIILENDESDSS